MQKNIDGIMYEHGAEHAGLTLWIENEMVRDMETNTYVGKLTGDWCNDELINYLVDPDTYKRPGVLITDERGKKWPLRNTHRGGPKGGSVSADVAGSTPAASTSSPAPVLAQQPSGGEWPKWFMGDTTRSLLFRYDNAAGDGCSFTNWTPGHVVAWKSQTVYGTPITESEAAQWLRANGHESVAAELERAGDYEPVGTMPVVGDRYTHTNWNTKAPEVVDKITGGHVWYVSNFDGTHDYRMLAQFLERDSKWRILKRTGERRPPAAGQAGVRVWKTNAKLLCPHAVLVGGQLWYIASNGHPQKAFSDRLQPAPEYHEITETPEAEKALADLCAKVPSAAAILGKG